LKVAHSKYKWPLEQYFHHAQQPANDLDKELGTTITALTPSTRCASASTREPNSASLHNCIVPLDVDLKDEGKDSAARD
jgi:hypothetical protein